MRVVVAGGSGLIGRRLTERLIREGHSVVLLSRSAGGRGAWPDGVAFAAWDGETKGEWWASVDGADVVVNLSGGSIAGGRWTPSRKRALTESRIRSTRAIVDAIQGAQRRPAVLANVSAVGYYGDVKEGEVVESHPPGRGFLPELAVRWETEAARAAGPDTRVVMPRLGIVLDSHGGALPMLALPFRLFVGGPLGSGRQWMPWVHMDDVVGAILEVITNPAHEGPVNVAAPGAVRMEEFCGVLGRVVRRPSWLPVPSFVLRGVLGEMAFVVLAGQRVIPRSLLNAGYVFRYPELEGALTAIYGRIT